jgi:hypothetical protein
VSIPETRVEPPHHRERRLAVADLHVVTAAAASLWDIGV